MISDADANPTDTPRTSLIYSKCKRVRADTMKHYVFGYGSLICSKSRAITVEALGGSDYSGIPVRLRKWIRAWNIRGPNTYLGVQSLEDETAKSASTFSCVGLLFPLPSNQDDHEESLTALDKRERGYIRQRVRLELIEPVMDLLVAQDTNKEVDQQERESTIYDHYYKNTFLDSSANREDLAGETTESEVRVWIYVPIPKYTVLANNNFPFLQSYVDVCMRGCLAISRAFADEFVEGTYGWYPGDSRRCEFITTKDQDEDWDSPSSSCWVNDREKPKYSRANKEYALEHTDALDAPFGPNLVSRRETI